jgi:hypothetical protein
LHYFFAIFRLLLLEGIVSKIHRTTQSYNFQKESTMPEEPEAIGESPNEKVEVATQTEAQTRQSTLHLGF